MCSSDGSGGWFRFTIVSSSSRRKLAFTMVGEKKSLFGPRGGDTMYAGSSAGGSGGALQLAFGTPIGGSVSLLGGGGWSDRGG